MPGHFRDFQTKTLCRILEIFDQKALGSLPHLLPQDVKANLLFSKISIVKDAGFETVYKQQRKSGLKQNVADLIKGSSRKCGDVRFLANGNSRKASLKIKLSCHP